MSRYKTEFDPSDVHTDFEIEDLIQVRNSILDKNSDLDVVLFAANRYRDIPVSKLSQQTNKSKEDVRTRIKYVSDQIQENMMSWYESA